MMSLGLPLAALLLGCAAYSPTALAAASAAPTQIGMSETEQAAPAMPPLLSMRARAEVIDAEKLTGERVTFGTSVGVADEETDEELVFHIVGPYEADTSRGLVSTSSPIARGLIGKSIGDSAEVHTPGGTKSYEIISIDLFDMDRVVA